LRGDPVHQHNATGIALLGERIRPMRKDGGNGHTANPHNGTDQPIGTAIARATSVCGCIARANAVPT
jgi:hypothetical protein